MTNTHRAMQNSRTFATVVVACLAALAAAAPAHATTKGLNQIVTPDVQPQDDLSVSFQLQHAQIGNANEIQVEYGVAKGFEVAVFQGFSPNSQVLGTELSLIAHGPYLLSTGFINWDDHGAAPQPFLEGGYYKNKDKFIAGAIRVSDHSEALLGYAHQLKPRLNLSVDYQSGTQNFSTAGFTYNVTPHISVNPALYYSNSSPHHTYGYAVVTFDYSLKKGG